MVDRVAAPIRTVELFAGIGGFRLAADSLGLRTVWANDLCPFAAKVYRDRFGDEELHEGDLQSLAPSVPAHDLLTGGFPCQPFSAAGKKQGIADPRGTLFALIADQLHRLRPAGFVLENVRRLLTMDRGRHFAAILRTIVAAGYRVEWRVLNAADFSLPQNRYRLMIRGLRDDRLGADDFAASRGLLGQDSLSAPAMQIAIASRSPRPAETATFLSWGRADDRGCVTAPPSGFALATKRRTLQEILQQPAEVGATFDFSESTRRRIADSSPVGRWVDGVEIIANQAGGARMGYTVFGVRGLSPTLTATTSRHYERYRIGRRYRRLTAIEYARLQGFDDEHCAAVPLSRRYRLLGNAVPPPLAAWALSRTIEEIV